MYNEQQNLIEYIHNATKQMKKLEKIKEARQEKLQKEDEKTKNPYIKELNHCNSLIDYFQRMEIENPNASTSQSNFYSTKSLTFISNEMNNLDISTGKVSDNPKTDRFEVVNPFPLSSSENKKFTSNKQLKDFGKKVSKRESKVRKSTQDIIFLDIDKINKIKELELNPPSYKSEVPDLIKKLSWSLSMLVFIKSSLR